MLICSKLSRLCFTTYGELHLAGCRWYQEQLLHYIPPFWLPLIDLSYCTSAYSRCACAYSPLYPAKSRCLGPIVDILKSRAARMHIAPLNMCDTAVAFALVYGTAAS